jgi:hypothetical protein
METPAVSSMYPQWSRSFLICLLDGERNWHTPRCRSSNLGRAPQATLWSSGGCPNSVVGIAPTPLGHRKTFIVVGN